MTEIYNDFVIQVATINGSGSQSANNVLVRTLFRMGLPVGGKNLFPSNIQGMPTWFTIRAHPQGFVSRRAQHDVVVAMNPATALQDMKDLKSGGFYLYNNEIKIAAEQLRSDVTNIAIPFRDIVAPVSDSVKLRKLLTNMVYVGILAEALGADGAELEAVIEAQFGDKASVIESNRKAIHAGRDWARANHLHTLVPFKVKAIPGGNDGKVLIDGNSAAGIGMVFGGCTFAAWYPITPSSSLIESFQKYANRHRLDQDGRATYAVVQGEDELASICMVLGAGWAGARAMTATSGPGLSLMAEAAGLSYFAEIPAVIWDVQRVGPSTGLPTRTMQGDILFAAKLSHGDTRHVLLFPSNPCECFEFAQTAFDLAEHLQTLVLVMSDLDLGMNLHICPDFNYPNRAYDRGKVLHKDDLDRLGQFARYKDIDGDAIPYRTLPGTEHPLAAYFTRGTGHDEKATYSENNQVWRANMDRLARKYETAKKHVPPPAVDLHPQAKVGIVAYGTTHSAIAECRQELTSAGIPTSYLRLKALPLTSELEDFLAQHDRVYLVEQNRDAQMMTLMREDFPQHWQRLRSVLQYDGLPLDAHYVSAEILRQEGLR